MMKKFVLLLLAGLILNNYVYAEDCKVIKKSAKYFENKIENENGHNDACLYYNLAAAHWRKGNIQGTLDAYDIMTYIDPQDEEIYVRRAILYSMYQNENRAHEEWARLVKNIPESKIGNENMAHVYHLILDYEKALKHVNKAIELSKGTDIRLFNKRAFIYRDAGEYEKAIKDYTKYLEYSLKEENKDYWWISVIYEDRAECYKALGKTDEAAKDMQKHDEYYKISNSKKYTIFDRIRWKYNDFKTHRYAEKLM